MAARVQVDLVRPVAEEVLGDRPADRGRQDEQDDEDAAADRDLVASEAPPDLLPVPAGANRLDFAELPVRLDRDRRRETGLRADEIALFLLGRHRSPQYSLGIKPL